MSQSDEQKKVLRYTRLCVVPISGVARIFQQGGPKRGSGATERGEGVGGGCPPPTVGRFFENLCMKTAFSSTLNDIIGGGGGSYVRWHVYKSLIYPPFSKFLLLQLRESMGPCAS